MTIQEASDKLRRESDAAEIMSLTARVDEQRRAIEKLLDILDNPSRYALQVTTYPLYTSNWNKSNPHLPGIEGAKQIIEDARTLIKTRK